MPALVVIPIGDSFQHPEVKAMLKEDASVQRLAEFLDGLDDAAFNELTPVEYFHSWPSLNEAVSRKPDRCRFLLVATEQLDDSGLPLDQARDSKHLLNAVRRFLTREFGDVQIETIIAHPYTGHRQLHDGLIRLNAWLSHATAIYIMGGSTPQVRGHLADLLPALVHGGCPVMRPVANRITHSHWEILRAVDADQVPLVALLLRSLEAELHNLAEAALGELERSPHWTDDDEAAFDAAIKTPLGSVERRALIEFWGSGR